jgi:hypothetical protein
MISNPSMATGLLPEPRCREHVRVKPRRECVAVNSCSFACIRGPNPRHYRVPSLRSGQEKTLLFHFHQFSALGLVVRDDLFLEHCRHVVIV